MRKLGTQLADCIDELALPRLLRASAVIIEAEEERVEVALFAILGETWKQRT